MHRYNQCLACTHHEMRGTPGVMDEYLSSRCLSRAADCQSITGRRDGKLIKAFAALEIEGGEDDPCLSDSKLP